MKNQWTIGRVRITRVVEIEGPAPGPFILRDAVPERIQEIGWLRPHFATTSGKLLRVHRHGGLHASPRRPRRLEHDAGRRQVGADIQT